MPTATMATCWGCTAIKAKNMGMTKRLFEELSCEERFELDAQCDIWQADAIAAQDRDMVDEEMARQSDALIAEDAERDLLIAEELA